MATIKTNQQKITPCLWLNSSNIEEAVKFYTSVFKKSKIVTTSYYGEGAPMPKGTVLTTIFKIEGQEFMALNGGPAFQFNEAISFAVNCKTQKEIDYFWEKLSKGGEKQQCGWLKDKFGVSWQIVPDDISKMLTGKHSAKVMDVILKMKKPNIKALAAAYAGK